MTPEQFKAQAVDKIKADLLKICWRYERDFNLSPREAKEIMGEAMGEIIERMTTDRETRLSARKGETPEVS